MTEPTDSGWEFVTQLKKHENLEVIMIPRMPEQALDPCRHLLELRKRIRQLKQERKCMEGTGFWMEENGKKMSYEKIRKAAEAMMRAAGIVDRPGHLKHAAVSELQRRAATPEEIAAFARHKQRDVWAARYWDSKNSIESVKKIVKIK